MRKDFIFLWTKFNIYINDISETVSKKVYICIWHRHVESGNGTGCEIRTNVKLRSPDTERILHVLEAPAKYTNKTVLFVFHLNNKQANNTLNVMFNGWNVTHNTHPKYLGTTFDWTLSYKSHLANVTAKINSCNNIIQKLTGTEWSADFSVLRTLAVALVYSAAEYCANKIYPYRIVVTYAMQYCTLCTETQTSPTKRMEKEQPDPIPTNPLLWQTSFKNNEA